jgi:hypothetical protein
MTPTPRSTASTSTAPSFARRPHSLASRYSTVLQNRSPSHRKAHARHNGTADASACPQCWNRSRARAGLVTVEHVVRAMSAVCARRTACRDNDTMSRSAWAATWHKKLFCTGRADGADGADGELTGANAMAIYTGDCVEPGQRRVAAMAGRRSRTSALRLTARLS